MLKGLRQPSDKEEEETEASSTTSRAPLYPVLREDRSYFLLGQEANATDLFTFTIQIISGENVAAVKTNLSVKA